MVVLSDKVARYLSSHIRLVQGTSVPRTVHGAHPSKQAPEYLGSNPNLTRPSTTLRDRNQQRRCASPARDGWRYQRSSLARWSLLCHHQPPPTNIP